jgi:hypothetical protein
VVPRETRAGAGADFVSVVRVVFAGAEVAGGLEVGAATDDAGLADTDPVALDAEVPGAGPFGVGPGAAEQPAIPRIPTAATAAHHPMCAKSATPARAVHAQVCGSLGIT